MAIDVKSISQLISEFRKLQTKDSITPESLGYILQRLADLLATAGTSETVANIQKLLDGFKAAGQAITALSQGQSDRNHIYANKTTVNLATGAVASSAGIFIQQATTERAGAMRAQQVTDLNNARRAVAEIEKILETVQVKLGMTDDMIRRGLLTFVSTDKRQNIYDVGGITVIDDCYNASPESMRAAIDVLTSIASRRGVKPCALLGDMLELGEYSRLMHDQLGQYAAQMKVQKLYCYGAMADVVAEAAIKKGVRADNVYVSLDSDNPMEMAKMINSSMQSGDVLLVKASRAVSAERVIEALKKIRKK